MASGQAVAGRGRPEETDRERSEHAAAAASFVSIAKVRIDAVCPLCAHSLLSVSHGKTTLLSVSHRKTTAATTAKPHAK